MGVYPFDPIHFQHGGSAGVRILESPFAETTKVWHEVVPASSRPKRRKRWRSMRFEKREPAMYWCSHGGGYFIAHPDIVKKLKETRE